MNIRRTSIALLVPLFCLCGCQPKVESERPVIQFVSDLIQDKSNPGHHLLGSFKPKDADGNIVICGPQEEVTPLSLSLFLSDNFDNVDARPIRDSLLDFSGEVISRVILKDASPLSSYKTEEGATRLRELTVKAALASLDTLSFRTLADMSSYSHKSKGKVLVLTSSAMASYGKYDLDSLLREFHIADAVFFPIDLMTEKIAGNEDTRVGIVSSKPFELYEEYFKYQTVFEGSLVGVFPKEAVLDSVSVVKAQAIDVLLLDDYSVRADSIRVRFPRVKVIAPGEVVSEACFKAMRRRNIFTHRVAYPKLESYNAILNEDSEFILTDSDDR
ncbi:MAG: hypothetical protein J6X39_03335 [Bacteroidales bacterium]|nr:hypothetical protein [Bacteroidales bacterium]